MFFFSFRFRLCVSVFAERETQFRRHFVFYYTWTVPARTKKTKSNSQSKIHARRVHTQERIRSIKGKVKEFFRHFSRLRIAETTPASESEKERGRAE